MAANSCLSSETRCLGCPAGLLEGQAAYQAAEMIDAAAADPQYAHLPLAVRGEILGMAAQTTERYNSKSFVAVVAGGLLLVATRQCDRSK